jgi:chromosomal replication initiation ATPase DnaA
LEVLMGVLELQARDRAAARLAAGVASYALGAPVEEILDVRPGGPRETAFARQVAAYLCHVGFEMSLARVATAFGRDRSTIAHACHAIEDRREDAQFDLWIGELETMLQQTPDAQWRPPIEAKAS